MTKPSSILRYSSRFIICCFFISCDQAFDPKAEFEQQLVVYARISNDRNNQILRVHTNYEVSGFDPYENTVDRVPDGLRVTITESLNLFTFRDTLLVRSDTSRYKEPLPAFVASPFQPEHGKRYDLSIVSPTYGVVTSSIVMPTKPVITIAPGTLILDQPDQFGASAFFYFVATISLSTKGYLGQVFIDYQVRVDSTWRDERTEVPYHVIADTLGKFYAVYPTLKRTLTTLANVGFRKIHYVKAIAKVHERYPHHSIVFKRVVFRLMQCEANLYDYFNTVNGFRDPHSIRLDMPAFSNISGATGIFGAYALDSVTHILPDDFRLNAR